jgi:hypothetical protein
MRQQPTRADGDGPGLSTCGRWSRRSWEVWASESGTERQWSKRERPLRLRRKQQKERVAATGGWSAGSQGPWTPCPTGDNVRRHHQQTCSRQLQGAGAMLIILRYLTQYDLNPPAEALASDGGLPAIYTSDALLLRTSRTWCNVECCPCWFAAQPGSLQSLVAHLEAQSVSMDRGRFHPGTCRQGGRMRAVALSGQ